MADPQHLADCRVAILGLGLMGGSLAYDLQGRCAARLGIDRDAAVVEAALRAGAIEQGACDPHELLPQADVIVLAVPVLEIIRLIQDLPALHPGSPVALDLGSTKRQILAAMELLPARFQPIGGHPMCGKETGGFTSACAGLYQSAPFALVEAQRTTSLARRIAGEIALAIGARPFEIDAPVHDRWVAATSHLPYLLACALAAATPQEARPLAGPGLRSATRLAATPQTMMLDILRTNSEDVMAALARFRTELDALDALLETGSVGGTAGGAGAGRRAEKIPERSGPMKMIVHPSAPLHGSLNMPGDKSLSHRAVLLAALARGRSRIGNLQVSGVTRKMLAAVRQLGAAWRLEGHTLALDSPGIDSWRPPAGPIDCGNSATTLRLLTGALAASGLPAALDGSQGLRRRPMERILAPLQSMGVPVSGFEGQYAPIELAARPRQHKLRARGLLAAGGQRPGEKLPAAGRACGGWPAAPA